MKSECCESSGGIGRALAIWLGSYVVVASLLIVYFRMPILPLACAGVVTLMLTLVRARSKS